MSFQPDIALFPRAPVDDAVTSFGAGEPHSWPGRAKFCPVSRGPIGQSTAFGGNWSTIRHDWSVDGQAKSWIVSETTMGFADLAEYDNYVRGFRYEVTYCGWGFDRLSPLAPYNSILTELDGLPSDAFAFSIDVSPGEDYGEPLRVEPSNPDDFQAFGAVLPGRQRGQLMFVTWIGWGVDVPRDEFVATANALYDAAVNAPDPAVTDSDDADDSSPADLRSVRFNLPGSSVPDTIDGTIENDPWDLLTSDRCNIEKLTDNPYVTNAPRFDARQALIEDGNRSVMFSTGQWQSRSSYLEAVEFLEATVGRQCVDSRQHQSLMIEPVTLPDLPDDTFVSVWNREGSATSVPEDGAISVAVVTDDDLQAIMVIGWFEMNGPVPTETFVEVINQAWGDFVGVEAPGD